MTEIYDDRIYANTTQWINTNPLCRLINGNKSAIIPAIKELVKRGYLETQPNKFGKPEYRRIDKAQSDEHFDNMMSVKGAFEKNKQTAITRMKDLNLIVTKEGKLTKKCDALLDWIQSELLDMAFMIMIRFKYQDTLKLLPHSVVNKRIQIIQNFIDSVMESLKPLKNEKLIREHFQNHTHQLAGFKV